MPFCSSCKRPSREIHYPTGGLCPTCREQFETAREREREDERRRREVAFQRGLRSVRDFFRHDRVFYAAIRRTDWDDPVSVQHLYGFALQRGRPDYAERLREVAREKGFDTVGWEKMIPERLNPGERRIRRRDEKRVRGGDVITNGFGSEVEVPRFLYRGSDDRRELEAIPATGFMVATTFFAAKEYGRWVAKYEFLGGVVRFGFSSVLSKIEKDLGGGASSWHHEADPDACEDYGGDLYLAGMDGEDVEHAVVCNTKTLRLIEISDSAKDRRRNDGDDHVVRWKLLSIESSRIKDKKLTAIFHDRVHDRTKTVHFGAVGYEDYTTHKDPKRKERYLERHGRGREDWDDPTTPGALSRWVLWNKPTLRASIADFKRRFRL